MNTLVQFPADDQGQSWDQRYYLTTESLSDGEFIEFVVAEMNFGCAFGVANATSGLLSAGLLLWPFNATTAVILAGGTSAATYTRSIGMFDRFRFTRSGSNILITQNGSLVHSQAFSGTIYGYVSSHSGVQSSVNVDAIKGAAPTTRSAVSCTVTPGVPATDFFASNSSLAYTPISWVGSGNKKASSQPGSTLRFKFTGAKCGILLDASGQVALTSDIRTTIGYRIDDGEWSYHKIANERLSYHEIATGLEDGTHSADVVISASYLGARYGTGRYAEIISYGVRLPTGESVSSPEARTRLAAGAGDSNSEGSQSVVDGSSNELVSFSQLIADALNADIALSSVPGQGFLTTPDTENDPPVIPTFANGWDLYPDGTSKLVAGKITPEPAVMFICHGQNDSADITSIATSVLIEMLAATVSTVIVVMCPAGRHRRSELMAAVAAVGSVRVLFFDNPTDWLANYSYQNLHVHLTEEGHVQYAAVMIPQFGAVFPSPPTSPYSPLREMYASDWQYLPNIQEAGFAFHPQRGFFTTTPTPPASGVRVRKSNPTQSQMIAASAQGIGIDGTDQQITIWAKTLVDDYSWEPKKGDVIIILDEDGAQVERWIIERVKRTLFGAQFSCYCKLSPRTPAQAQRP